MNSILAPAQDLALSKQAGEILERHYPGYLWAVHADTNGGVLLIHNLALHGRWGFQLNLRDVYSDPGLKSVVAAGGELLERYKMKRGKFDADAWRAAPKDIQGQLVGDNG